MTTSQNPEGVDSSQPEDVAQDVSELPELPPVGDLTKELPINDLSKGLPVGDIGNIGQLTTMLPA